jgi:hypothetical protein
MKYRIIQCSSGYLPQYKYFLRWKDIQRNSPYGKLSVYYSVLFNAQNAIEQFKLENRNRNKPKVVYQTK